MTPVEGRVPPHDLDAEGAVLSAVMVDPSAYDKVSDIIKPEHFYSEAHRRIFEACAACAIDGKPIDVVTVATWLRDCERLAQAGGMAYLTEVLNTAPAVANVEAYAKTIFERWYARQGILICQRYTSAGYAGLGSYGGGVGYVQALADDVYALTCVDARTQVQEVRVVLRSAFQAILAAKERGSHISGIATGFDRYDRLTGGLHAGELTIIAARPGMGKTSLALQFLTGAASMAVRPPTETETPTRNAPKAYGAILFSLEMDREPVVTRMVCCEAKVDLTRVRTGALTPTDWSKLTQAAKHLGELRLWIDDQPALTVSELRSKVRRTIAQAEHEEIEVVLVVVDYLQLMEGSGNEQSREQEVSGISRGLKKLAKELHLPIVALSQLNRAVETRGAQGKRPQLSDLRESGAIEQDADNICFIYRDEYYNRESEDRNIAELIVAKQRNGSVDTVRVRWDGAYTRFDNLAEGEWAEGHHGDH